MRLSDAIRALKKKKARESKAVPRPVVMDGVLFPIPLEQREN